MNRFNVIEQDLYNVSDFLSGRRKRNWSGMNYVDEAEPLFIFVERHLSVLELRRFYKEFEVALGLAISQLSASAASGNVDPFEKKIVFDLESDFKQLIRDVKPVINKLNEINLVQSFERVKSTIMTFIKRLDDVAFAIV